MYSHREAVIDSFNRNLPDGRADRSAINPITYHPRDSYSRHDWFSDFVPETHTHTHVAHGTSNSGLQTAPTFSGGHSYKHAEHLPDRFKVKDYNMGTTDPKPFGPVSDTRLMIKRGSADYQAGLDAALAKAEKLDENSDPGLGSTNMAPEPNDAPTATPLKGRSLVVSGGGGKIRVLKIGKSVASGGGPVVSGGDTVVSGGDTVVNDVGKKAVDDSESIAVNSPRAMSRGLATVMRRAEIVGDEKLTDTLINKINEELRNVGSKPLDKRIKYGSAAAKFIKNSGTRKPPTPTKRLK